MAGTDYQNSSKGINSFGFKSQPTNDNNPMANFLQSNQNLTAAEGATNSKTGAATIQAGAGAMAPAMDYLTKLVKGDQADVTQATQPQVNQIKDSFSAIRNLISAAPRGGGKAGTLAEAPYQQQKQITDMQNQARSGASGQLGTMAGTLAGIGQGEAQLGESQQALGMDSALQQRGQNIGQTSKSFSEVLGSIGQAAGAII